MPLISSKAFALVVGLLSIASTANAAVAPSPWDGMNLYEWAQSGKIAPDCGDLGQEKKFQGADLINRDGVCVRVNICHGNAGINGWNSQTVDRDAIGIKSSATGNTNAATTSSSTSNANANKPRKLAPASDGSGHATQEHNYRYVVRFV